MKWSEFWKALPFVSWPACFSRRRPVPSLSLFPSYIWLYWRSSCYLSIAPLCLVPFVCVYRVFAWPRPLSSATPLYPPTSDSFQSMSSVGYFWFAIWVLNRHIRRWTNSIFFLDTVYVTCLLTLLTNTSTKMYNFVWRQSDRRDYFFMWKSFNRPCSLFREWHKKKKKFSIQTDPNVVNC